MNGKKRGGSLTFTKILAFICTFVTLTVTLKALAGSSSPRMLTSLIPAERRAKWDWWLWKLGAALFHFITNGFHFFTAWLQWSSIVSFSLDVSDLVKNVAPHEKCHHSDHLVAANTLARTHTSLGVLEMEFTSFYGSYMAATQTIFTFCVVLNAYQAVDGGSIRSLVIALGIAFGYVQFVEVTAEVYHASVDVLEAWRRVGRRDVPEWFPAYLRSCRFLYIPVGSFFYVDRGLVLTVLSVMLNTSASLIITL